MSLLLGGGGGSRLPEALEAEEGRVREEEAEAEETVLIRAESVCDWCGCEALVECDGWPRGCVRSSAQFWYTSPALDAADALDAFS